MGWLSRLPLPMSGKSLIVRLQERIVDFNKSLQLANPRRVSHFAQGFGFDLANAFARDLELLANFFEGAGITVPEAEAKFQHFALAFAQAAKDIAQLIF